MYHVELRKFPHTVCRFNQSEQQLRAIVAPWCNEEWIEEGERKWNSNEASLTVLEGPKLSMPDLAMGRGWRNAQRRSEDVTARVLAAARAQRAAGSSVPATGDSGPAADVAPADGGVSGPAATGAAKTAVGEGRPAERAAEGEVAGDSQLLADSLGLELLGLLDAGPTPLARVWELAAQRLDDASAVEALGLAELAVRSLIGRGLAVLQTDLDADGHVVGDDRIEAAVRAVESWAGGERRSLVIARKA